jgi:hypothetical protein
MDKLLLNILADTKNNAEIKILICAPKWRKTYSPNASFCYIKNSFGADTISRFDTHARSRINITHKCSSLIRALISLPKLSITRHCNIGMWVNTMAIYLRNNNWEIIRLSKHKNKHKVS